MSGLVSPEGMDVAMGLAYELALKTTVPLTIGLVASALPGSASSRHARLGLALASVPVLWVATVAWRGADAAVWDAPVWPAGLALMVALVLVTRLLLAVRALNALPTTESADGILHSEQVQAPITAGWWHPRIIVPSTFDQWPTEQRHAALAHERAHIRRRDWLVHVLVWALACVLWWHPLMHLARRRLSLLAECAADDAVLQQNIDPTRYAEQLLRMGQATPQAALAWNASPVATRIRAILAQRSRRGASPSALLGMAALLSSAGLALADIALWDPPEPIEGCIPARSSWMAPWETPYGSEP